MIAIARYPVLNKYLPPIERFEGKKAILTARFYCRDNDVLLLISESFYVWKDGSMWIVENKNNERFLIDKNYLEMIDFNLDDNRSFLWNQ